MTLSTGRPADGPDGVFVVLLRGINVGGRNALPMRDLTAMCLDVGCREVRTYIQSGNVVFRASPELARRIPEELPTLIETRTRLRVPVVLRSATELATVTRSNPFIRTGANPGALHVMFLADGPGPGAVAALDPERSPPDRFVVAEREIYLHCPNGVARSKLTNQYFDTRLGTVSTSRNWRTVLKLAQMASG